MSVKIEFNNPFSIKGNWYKGNLHTHTTNSDGELSPEDVISSYRKKGYDFLVITDHNKLTHLRSKPVGDGFIRPGSKPVGVGFIRPGGLDKSSPYLIPGEEIDGGKSAVKGSARRLAEHFVAIVSLVSQPEIIPPSEYQVRCRRRPGRKPCTGMIEADLDPETEDIVWWCPICRDTGYIRNWKGTIWDLSNAEVIH